MKHAQELPATVTSIKEARSFATAALTDVEVEPLREIVLMVSELATNAIRHAESSFVISIERRGSELRVTVTDRGAGRPTMRTPSPQEPSGRGLGIVADLSDRWGVDDERTGKSVWFVVDLERRAAGDTMQPGVERSTEAGDGNPSSTDERIVGGRPAPSPPASDATPPTDRRTHPMGRARPRPARPGRRRCGATPLHR